MPVRIAYAWFSYCNARFTRSLGRETVKCSLKHEEMINFVEMFFGQKGSDDIIEEGNRSATFGSYANGALGPVGFLYCSTPSVPY